MLAGQPGAGKSTIALWHSIIWAKDHNLIGIYFSADSSELVAASRTAAMVLNRPVKEMEIALQNTDRAALEAIAQTSGISWCFDPEITLDGIDLELAAFEEMWGRVPDFCVIDNLTDVEQSDGDEFGALRRVMRDLTYLARTTSAAVLALHHTSENEKDDPCPPRKAIHGKINQKPALILTTAETHSNGRKPIAIVKSRFGMSNKYGKDPVWINQDAQSLAFTDDWQVAA